MRAVEMVLAGGSGLKQRRANLRRFVGRHKRFGGNITIIDAHDFPRDISHTKGITVFNGTLVEEKVFESLIGDWDRLKLLLINIKHNLIDTILVKQNRAIVIPVIKQIQNSTLDTVEKDKLK